MGAARAERLTSRAFALRTLPKDAGWEELVLACNIAVQALTDAGLLRRIDPAGSAARCEVATGDNHHLVCRACHEIVDVACGTGEAPAFGPATTPTIRPTKPK